MEESIRLYQQQDIQKMKGPPLPIDAPEEVRRYFDGIYAIRDENMAIGMKPYLVKGNTFVAVGAAHLEGIMNTLQTEGFTVESIPLGRRDYSIDGTISNGEKVVAFRTNKRLLCAVNGKEASPSALKGEELCNVVSQRFYSPCYFSPVPKGHHLEEETHSWGLNTF